MECATKDAQIDEEIKVSNGTPPVRLKYLFPNILLYSLIIQKNPAKSSEAKA